MDHSLLQELVDRGFYSAEEAQRAANKNYVTRALGVEAERGRGDSGSIRRSKGDVFILCSDGLSDMVEDDDIHLTINTFSANLDTVAKQLIQLANDNGGRDNVSVVLAQVMDSFPARTRSFRQDPGLVRLTRDRGKEHMARLILSLDGQVMAEYNMNKERYTIGRLPDNDIRIDNPAVSGHHSLIINILNDSFLEDLNSTNGTYVNGKLIKKHALQHGDVITVGHHQLRFVEDDEAAGRVREDHGHPALAPARWRSCGAAAAASEKTGSPSLRATGKARALRWRRRRVKKAKLQVLSGAFAGRELELSKALTTLGRPGVQVAAITRRAEGYFIVHVDSGKADDFPLVNGTPIGAKRHQAA